MSSELEYLKELHARLSEKIKSLESEAAKKLPTKKTPAQQLRTVLIGPPGAGTSHCPYIMNSGANMYVFE